MNNEGVEDKSRLTVLDDPLTIEKQFMGAFCFPSIFDIHYSLFNIRF